MINEFITLSITETIPGTGEFSVIAMEIRSQNIISLNLREEEIISKQGDIIWDIGFITHVKEIRKNSISYANPTYTATGTSIGANKIASLKSILEAKSNSPQDFFNNEKIQYAIIKTSNVHDISVYVDKQNYNEKVLKYYLSATISNISAVKNPICFLNKDYRWINFWGYMYKSLKFDKKKQEYLKLFNRREKTLYLILHRYHFKNNSSYWISGMHWL